MKSLSAEYFLIEQYLKLNKYFDKAEPVFVCKVFLKNYCIKFIPIYINDNSVDLYNEDEILKYFNEYVNNQLCYEKRVYVLNPFANLHNNVYSLRNPPSALTHPNQCYFKDFINALDKYNVKLCKKDDNKLSICEK